MKCFPFYQMHLKVKTYGRKGLQQWHFGHLSLPFEGSADAFEAVRDDRLLVDTKSIFPEM